MGKARGLRRVLGALLAIVLVATLALGAWIGLSARRVGELFGQMSGALATAQERIEAQDYDAAIVSAREAAAYSTEASEELAGAQWDIASKLPILGVDAGIMRSVGSISGKLSNDAIVPLLDGWDTLAADGLVVNDQIDLSRIGDKVDQIVALAQTLQTADEAVNACSTEAAAIPASHFAQLNEWVGQLKSTITSIDEMLDRLVGIADLVTGASSFFSSFATGV